MTSRFKGKGLFFREKGEGVAMAREINIFLEMEEKNTS